MTNRIVNVILRGDITGLKASLAAASKSVADTTDRLTGASKESAKFRSGLTSIGNTAGKVGLVAAAGLGAIVAATANFDSAMSKVQAATHESTANMEQLRAAAIKAGADTVYSASEAAGAIESLAKAGISTKDILGGGLSGALNLAAAGGLEVADAADIAATALTQFKLSGSDVPHVADLLAAGAGKAQGDVSDMGMALKQSGLVASQMGISIEETTGTLAEFASAGLLGSDAGTSFRTMLLRLANPTKESATLMEQLGINAYDANGQFVGMQSIAGQLATAFKGKTQAERDSAMATIFGSDAIRAASVLYQGGAQGVADWTGKVNEAGYASETAATRLDNLSGDLEQLKGSLETALIGMGEGSQGPLRELVQGLTTAVNAFNSLPGPIKTVGTALLAITAVTGGGLWFGSRVVRTVADTRAALGALGVTAEGTRGKLRGVAGFMAGPWGIALTVGALALGKYAAGQAETRARVDSLSESLDAQSGAITDNTKKLMAQTLEQHGVLEAAKELGLGLDVVTNAALGSSADMATVSDRIKEIQTGLAAMGTTDAGADPGLTKLGDAMGVVTDAVNGGNKEIDAAREKTLRLAEASGAAATSTDQLAGAQQGAAGAASGLAAGQEEADKALAESRDAANKVAHEFFGLGDSLDDAKVSLSGWLTDLEKQATALRDFTKNARTAAKHGLKEGLIAELEAAGPAGARRMQQLANASDTEIARANRAWRRGQKAIDDYTNAVGGVPRAVATEVQVHDRAAADIARIKRELAGIPRELRTTYYVTQINRINKIRGMQQERADGGYITGPGTRTSDSIPAYLSNGEYVVRAAAVEKYGTAMFDGLNAMRYADGGRVRFASGGAARKRRDDDDEHGKTGHALKRLRKELEKAKKAVEDETKVRDDLTQQREQLASSISGSLTSDLFTKQGAFSPQGGIVSGALSTLSRDIAKANQYAALEQQLSARGLSGQALTHLESTGDVSILAAFAAASQSDLASFQSLFSQRASATAGAGDVAGAQAFGAEQAKATQQLVLLNRAVAKLEKAIDRQGDKVGDKVGSQINSAASAGKKRRKVHH